MTLVAPSPVVRDVATASRAIRAAAVTAPGTGQGATLALDRIGLELERFVLDPVAPYAPVRIERTRAALHNVLPLPGGSTVTYEPGGQLELSTPPAADLDLCAALLETDLRVVDRALAEAGLVTLALGSDPVRPAKRLLDEPRYEAMQDYFDSSWPAGRSMMCSTAALQINLELGDPADDGSGPQSVPARWRRSHLVGPVLLAAFANSPRLHGQATGYVSSRAQVWSRIDRRRTRPVGGPDPAAAWSAYALRAGVMFTRQPDGRCVPVPDGITLADWAAGRTDLRPLQAEDVAYHLTTLFPPVRPRGFLELRFLDTLPAPWWQAAAAITTAVMNDSETALLAEDACRDLPGGSAWSRAGSRGLRDPAIAAAAKTVLRAVPAALPRIGAARLDGAVIDFTDRFTERGRCPADDVLAPDLSGVPS
jgi:glutamate--cysteine ligase